MRKFPIAYIYAYYASGYTAAVQQYPPLNDTFQSPAAHNIPTQQYCTLPSKGP